MSELLIEMAEGPKGALAVACPFCRVDPGVDCVTERGRLTRLPHRRRFEAGAQAARNGLWLLQTTKSGSSWACGSWLAGRRSVADGESYEVFAALGADEISQGFVDRGSVHPVRLLSADEAHLLGLVEVPAERADDPVPADMWWGTPTTTWTPTDDSLP